ncbi:MAG: hypothetical protein LBK56_02605 [Gracilibacteraceae bacterium]|nr:hypothetical protein [Gracilibacteraceae bacterium]
MKNRLLPRLTRHVRAVILAALCALPLCGITVFAAEEGAPDLPRAAETQDPAAVTDMAPAPARSEPELYPADVQTIIDGDMRQIVKTYSLAPEQNPADIPRDSFERGGWRYSLTDITEKRISGTDIRPHIETVEITTDTKDLNAIIKLLSPTLDYEDEDGYAGLLTLDLSTVKCEEAGYKSSSYTVTATREYPHLSTNDLSLIPKTISENGRTLSLEDVAWEAQQTVNVDYDELPYSYRAVAKYTASASKTVAAGYVTAADYVGEVARTSAGETIYAAYFVGKEIDPLTPKPAQGGTPINLAPFIFAALGLAALLGGSLAFFFLRPNVKIYAISEGKYALAAKGKISAKSPAIDLTPLEGRSDGGRFELEIKRFAARSLSGKTVEARCGPVSLKHQIAYEGNAYRIEADFSAKAIRAIY